MWSAFSQHLHYSSNVLISMTGGLGPVEKTSDKIWHLAVNARVASLAADAPKSGIPHAKGCTRFRETIFPDDIHHPASNIDLRQDLCILSEDDPFRCAND